MGKAANAAGIAVVHTSFNVFATIMLLPFSKGLEKLATLTIREKAREAEKNSEESIPIQLLDSRFLDKPAFAL